MAPARRYLPALVPRAKWDPLTYEEREAFIEKIAEGRTVMHACAELRLVVSTVNRWIREGREVEEKLDAGSVDFACSINADGEYEFDPEKAALRREQFSFFLAYRRAKAASVTSLEEQLAEQSKDPDNPQRTAATKAMLAKRDPEGWGKRDLRSEKRVHRAKAEEAEAKARIMTIQAEIEGRKLALINAKVREMEDAALKADNGVLVLLPDVLAHDITDEEMAVLERVLIRQRRRMATEAEAKALVEKLPVVTPEDVQELEDLEKLIAEQQRLKANGYEPEEGVS